MIGGGYCGWTAPVKAKAEKDASVGGWFLKLRRSDLWVDPKTNHFYVELKNADNYASYKVPTRKPWSKLDSDVVTRFSKLRIDPHSLVVNTADFTYAAT